jgi:UDP-3-O-[3-hydroxymyristoyl] N-acetylglucosamine deacetylase
MKQKTLKKETSLSGVGLFTGEKVNLTLKPAPINSGIVFQRIDLPDRPKFFANLDFVKETPRCTIIGNEKVSILTVEHLLSALSAYEIDNLLIEIDGSEIPVGDGSSQIFVDLIENGQIEEQSAYKKIIKIKKAMYWSKGDVHIVALPSDSYRISYLLHYPHSDLLKSQYYTAIIDRETYKESIAPCRTFSIYEEIEPLLKKGFIKGGGLNNAVIIKDNKILNPDGIRFPEEMARHKILDLVGDLSLIGGKIYGHIIAIRSGHFSNISFAKMVLKSITIEDDLMNEGYSNNNDKCTAGER